MVLDPSDKGEGGVFPLAFVDGAVKLQSLGYARDDKGEGGGSNWSRLAVGTISVKGRNVTSGTDGQCVG